MFPARALPIAAIAALLAFQDASGQSFFETPLDFVIERPCDATSSIKTGADPTPLEVGKTYAAQGLNKKDGATHAYIRIDAATKWVALACGRLAGAGAGETAGMIEHKPTGQETCLPFFDTIDNELAIGFGGPADMTPEPPTLDEFDRAASKACGPPGHVVSEAEFKALMRANPAVLTRLRAHTGGKVFAHDTPAPSDEAYLDALTKAWFARNGFTHIFCGEPNPGPTGGKVGGLHFHARYLDLQTSGAACRMNNLRQQEAKPGVIYTMGLRMRNASGRFVDDARKGYGLTLSAEDLLKVATRAFAENPGKSPDASEGCWLKLTDDGHEFEAVFVRRSTGITTFYPDATPRGPGDRVNPPCAGTISLQD